MVALIASFVEIPWWHGRLFKSNADVTDYVRYLLDGSGAESMVDYAALRKDLEGHSLAGSILEVSSETSHNFQNQASFISNISERQSNIFGEKSSNISVSERKSNVFDERLSNLSERPANISEPLAERQPSSSEILSSSMKYIQGLKQSRSQENPEKIEIIAQLSESLLSLGISLPPTLSPSTLTSAQIVSLRDTFTSLINTVQEQQGKIMKLEKSQKRAEESLIAEQRRVVELETSHRSSISHDSELLASLEKSLRKSMDNETYLQERIKEILADLEKARKQSDEFRVMVMDQDAKIRELEIELIEMKEAVRSFLTLGSKAK